MWVKIGLVRRVGGLEVVLQLILEFFEIPEMFAHRIE